MTDQPAAATATAPENADHDHHAFRFHRPHLHLTSVFGDDWFAQRSEDFTRWFVSPRFALWRTVLIIFWVVANVAGLLVVDPYPFRFLNLLLTLLTAYAAPMILLAQMRASDRDKAHALADAQHREEIGRASEARQQQLADQTRLLLELVQQNTRMTETLSDLTGQVAKLTTDMHNRVVASDPK